MAKYWTPQRSVPSVSLGRIKPDKVTLDKLPDGPTEVDAADALTLVLGRRLGTRGLWDIYYASLLDASGEQRSGLVLKLIDLLQFPAEGRGNIQSTAARETSNVFQWFNLLEPLQGTIVPHSAGLFAHGTLYCMVFEDAGRELTHAEKMDEHVQ
jgi:hypothetical protein